MRNIVNNFYKIDVTCWDEKSLVIVAAIIAEFCFFFDWAWLGRPLGENFNLRYLNGQNQKLGLA